MTTTFHIHHHENNVDAFKARFVATLGDARETAKAVPAHLRADVIVDQVDVQSDKAGLIAALNGEPVVGVPLRTWGITARGALKEE
jgi:hypothetical protein